MRERKPYLSAGDGLEKRIVWPEGYPLVYFSYDFKPLKNEYL